jgi:hypothetical protein
VDLSAGCLPDFVWQDLLEFSLQSMLFRFKLCGLPVMASPVMKIIPSLACLLLTSLAAPAATVTITRGSPGSPEGLQLASYFTALPYSDGGYFIGVGTFAAPPVTSADLLSFIEFASGPSPTFGSSKGYISGSFTANPADPSVFSSKEIYILIGHAATLTQSTEQVVLRSSGAPWLFPTDLSPVSATTIVAMRNRVTGVQLEGLEPGFLAQAEGLDYVAMGPLTAPEPTTSLLALLGLSYWGEDPLGADWCGFALI